jgi:hypothetical protein
MATKLYYIDGRNGIKEFTVSDEDAEKEALVLPGLLVNPVSRRNLYTSLEDACAARCAAIDAHIAALQAQIDELTAERAKYMNNEIEVQAVAPTTTERRPVNQEQVAAALTRRSDTQRQEHNTK